MMSNNCCKSSLFPAHENSTCIYKHDILIHIYQSLCCVNFLLDFLLFNDVGHAFTTFLTFSFEEIVFTIQTIAHYLMNANDSLSQLRACDYLENLQNPYGVFRTQNTIFLPESLSNSDTYFQVNKKGNRFATIYNIYSNFYVVMYHFSCLLSLL